MKLTVKEKINRLWDINEISKVMSRYAYLHNAHEHLKTVELFALDREDIWIECGGIGIYTGPAGIKKFFYEWHESLTGDIRGAFNEHLLTTPIIEVAKDGKTAKAVWMSPGVETRRVQPDKQLEASWIWGKYAIDFIKVKDEWKFWHFTITLDFLCDYHHSWVETENTYSKKVVNNGIPPIDKPNSFSEDGYTKEKVTKLFPAPPEPYDHWEY
jgi:hypothetical protein